MDSVFICRRTVTYSKFMVNSLATHREKPFQLEPGSGQRAVNVPTIRLFIEEQKRKGTGPKEYEEMEEKTRKYGHDGMIKCPATNSGLSRLKEGGWGGRGEVERARETENVPLG